jgi:integrase
MCDEMLKTNSLVAQKSVLFETYATGFFEKGSNWYTDKCLDSVDGSMPITLNRLKGLRVALNCHLLPFWGKCKLEDITLYAVKKFRSQKIEDGYAVGSVDVMIACFKIIMDYAIAEGLIKESPLKGLKSVKGFQKKNKESFSFEDVLTLCDAMQNKEKRLWFFITAICTGMRLNEIGAIRRETLFDGYILCADQLGEKQTLIPPKTKKARYIPIPSMLQTKLEGFISSTGFCFKRHDGTMAQKAIAAFAKSNSRNVTLHSARHFFNTYMLAKNISSVKVAAVMGHTISDVSMQETYTNWEPTHFPEIIKEQEILLASILQSLNIE